MGEFQIHKSVRVIVNGKAGSMLAGPAVDHLKESIQAVLPDASIVIATSEMDISQLARDAVGSGSTLIVAGGGDGTVNAVASSIAGTEAVLGILPLGTLNHFCKDLGIPTELDSALKTLASGQVASIDVGMVNDHVFINNSSLGLYPDIVRLREARQKRGESKWIAAAVAAAKALLRYRRLMVRVNANGNQLLRRTPIVFLGNNEYVVEGLNLGKRERLDGGALFLLIPKETQRLKLIRLAAMALLGRLHENDDYDKLLSEEISISSGRQSVHVTVDGEVLLLTPPLHYRIRKKALRVLVPRSEG